MTIEIEGRLTRGDWVLDLDRFRGRAGVTAVIGPNGSGKTSALRLIAGLEALDEGSLRIGDDVLDEPSTARFRPAHERAVALVFQDHRLFGHLRAIDDVAFPLRRRGIDRRVARRRAHDLLELVGMAGHTGSRPDQLSGGQRQRVALARALAADPNVLLLDEPLASVDETSRRDLHHVLADGVAPYVILVSHDPVEVHNLAGSLVVLDGGRVASAGSVEQVTADPGSRWAALFTGANIVAGRARDGVVATESGFALTVVDRTSGPVHVTFPAHAVTLHPSRPEGSARNTWPARVERVDIEEGRARVTISGPIAVRADVTVRSVDELGLRPGARIWASVKATELAVVA